VQVGEQLANPRVDGLVRPVRSQAAALGHHERERASYVAGEFGPKRTDASHEAPADQLPTHQMYSFWPASRRPG
jgi:hypothetical protein